MMLAIRAVGQKTANQSAIMGATVSQSAALAASFGTENIAEFISFGIGVPIGSAPPGIDNIEGEGIRMPIGYIAFGSEPESAAPVINKIEGEGIRRPAGSPEDEESLRRKGGQR